MSKCTQLSKSGNGYKSYKSHESRRRHGPLDPWPENDVKDKTVMKVIQVVKVLKATAS